jgi:hypothetical protein
VIDFEGYEIKPDRVFFVSQKQIHNWDYSENSKGYILIIDSTLGEELNLNYGYISKRISGSHYQTIARIYNLWKISHNTFVHINSKNEEI